MKTYTVELCKPVQDILRAFVTVEAETAEEAERKALDMDMEEIEFSFWQCGDCNEPITADAMEA